MEFAEIVRTEPLAGMDAGPLWQQLREHTHDPVTAVCTRCGRGQCPGYVKARDVLAEHGLLEDDPS